MIEKLKQSLTWTAFINWHQTNCTPTWLAIDSLDKVDSLFTNLMFIRFIEEYFQCTYCRDEKNKHFLIGSGTTGYYLTFNDISDFNTVEELILAALETHDQEN